jgi:phosphoribosylglycinamide formyltransferase 1
MTEKALHIAVFVSGRGSNFRALDAAMQDGRLDADVALVVSSSEGSGALDYARERGYATLVVSHADPAVAERTLLAALREHGVTFVALAGYLKRIPADVVAAYRHRIVNIHPALLPSFGGAGMYGHHVHEAVLAAGCRVSGATVHVVDEEYDRGPIVAQRCTDVLPGDTPDTLAARVLTVEHDLYWRAIQLFATHRVRITDSTLTIL